MKLPDYIQEWIGEIEAGNISHPLVCEMIKHVYGKGFLDGKEEGLTKAENIVNNITAEDEQ